MTVRITKAEKETYWYTKHIGEVFEVEKCLTDWDDWEGYRTINDIPGGEDIKGYIEFSDCEVITEPKNNEHE